MLRERAIDKRVTRVRVEELGTYEIRAKDNAFAIRVWQSVISVSFCFFFLSTSFCRIGITVSISKTIYLFTYIMFIIYYSIDLLNIH